MGKTHDGIGQDLAEWIRQQHLFFVATAPLAEDGLINCSPKGMDSLRILGPREVAYVDLTGSGVETIAHSRENGRIVFMFCAFDGPPRIVRLHGKSDVVVAGMADYEELSPRFPAYPGRRAIIRARLTRVSDSCGYSVPRMRFVSDREALVRWAEAKGPDALRRYRREKNAASIDGLTGLEERAVSD